MMRTPFAESRFRRSAATAVEHLTDDAIDALLARYGSFEEVVDLMTTRARSVVDSFLRRGRSLPEPEYDLLAAAVLAVRTEFAVQANVSHIVKVHEALVARRVPADLAVPTRLLKDEESTGLLVATARVAEEVDEDTVPPMFVTMVTAALLAGLGPEVEGAAAKVRATLARADEVAAAHREGLEVLNGAAYPVLGNADIVGQVAAYHVAVAEATGLPGKPFTEVFASLATRLREGLTKPPGRSWWQAGGEPDIVVVLRAFAKVIGGAAAADVFRCLHREPASMTAGADRRRSFGDVTATPPVIPVDEQIVDADTLTRHLLDALYTGAGPRQRLVTQWLAGERRPDEQAELPFLVDRVRRVVVRLRRPGHSPPPLEPEVREHYKGMSAKVSDALRLGIDGLGVADSILPPLWTSRSAAVKLVQSKLRVRLPRSATTAARSALVAAIVVRSPGQAVLRTAPDRPSACLCGARGRRPPAARKPVEPDQACPHRTWGEWGAVEDYATLTAFAEFSTPDATRAQIRRYTGPWEDWVREVG